MELHRVEEISQACLAYVAVLEEEGELREQVEARERQQSKQERQQQRRRQRERDRRRGRNKDLTKAASFNCDELAAKSEFKDHYHRISGEHGEKGGRARVIDRKVIMTN